MQNIDLVYNDWMSVGIVVKISSVKTAIVRIETHYVHPIYKKSIKRFVKIMTHDLLGVKTGDCVRISNSRPLSKNKHHIIQEILERVT